MNTVERFYLIFKCGVKGVYRRSAEHHLHRYLAEFDQSVGRDSQMKTAVIQDHRRLYRVWPTIEALRFARL